MYQSRGDTLKLEKWRREEGKDGEEAGCCAIRCPVEPSVAGCRDIRLRCASNFKEVESHERDDRSPS